jgi:hypothetical protein
MRSAKIRKENDIFLIFFLESIGVPVFCAIISRTERTDGHFSRYFKPPQTQKWMKLNCESCFRFVLSILLIINLKKSKIKMVHLLFLLKTTKKVKSQVRNGRVKGPRNFLDTFELQKIDYCASRKNQDRKLVQKNDFWYIFCFG